MRLLKAFLAFFCLAVVDVVAQQGPLVLLDNYYNHEVHNGHRFHYTWDDRTGSGFSGFGAVFAAHGAQLEHLEQAPTAAALARGTVYIIVDPDTAAEAADHKPNFMDETAAQVIADWVAAGGTLLLMNNDKGNADFLHVNILAGKFGIMFNEDQRNDTPGNDIRRAVLDTRDAAAHPIFRGVDAIYMKQICTLSLKTPAEALLTAPKQSGKGRDIIMATCRFGKGRVIAVGDPWLYNEYIKFSPPGLGVANTQAATNLVAWLLQPVQQPDFLNSPEGKEGSGKKGSAFEQ
jgi:unsaturated rhamnogalacturonyl hydrolase